jgi:hypothetical protein
MKTHEWLDCSDPQRMLKSAKSKISDRKLRLFAVACARRVAHLPYRGVSAAISDKARIADKQAIAIAEEVAEGKVSVGELKAALKTTQTITAGRACTRASAFAAAKDTADTLYWFVHWHPATTPAQKATELPAQANLLRCIAGNPFCPCAWKPAGASSTVLNISQSIYTDCQFDRLPILADALEDAGCTDADILNHCRQPGEHVRGCWVVDLILGKE